MAPMTEPNVKIQRLGRRELGRHAFEERMPDKVVQALEREDAQNCTSGVINNLAKLLQGAGDTQEAYLCSKQSLQIWKLPNEGAHFCGYRNIMMMWSALPASQKHEVEAAGKLPNVLELQLMIEEAWTKGFNPHGKVLTGGIRGTRKHIGTSEAEALFLSRGLSCTGRVFRGQNAWKQLLDSIEGYFHVDGLSSTNENVKTTSRCPVFLQRPGHSLTIVGYERSKSGQRNILVFDPAWSAPSKMARPLTREDCSGWTLYWILRRYRKSSRYLQRFRAYETLEIECSNS